MKFVILAFLLSVAAAAKLPGEAHHVVSIISDTREAPVNGAFSTNFEADNGIKYSEIGRPGEAGQTNSEGTYSFVDENGNTIEVRFVANEFGFQPQGAHLPVAPPPPPHVAELLRIAEEQRAAGITFE
ncbi:cuticle protein AM1159-like [Oratosquilla oratoria]|uniref:cuticle protein AM1159-like n=1 Tax=Oratosquilla oratoria TaxID=337810 RepID=UPI003F7775B8